MHELGQADLQSHRHGRQFPSTRWKAPTDHTQILRESERFFSRQTLFPARPRTRSPNRVKRGTNKPSGVKRWTGRVPESRPQSVDARVIGTGTGSTSAPLEHRPERARSRSKSECVPFFYFARAKEYGAFFSSC